MLQRSRWGIVVVSYRCCDEHLSPPMLPSLGHVLIVAATIVYWTGGVCSWTGMPWKTTDRSTWATLNIYIGGMWWNFLFSFPAQDLLVVADGLDSRVAGNKGWFDLLDGFVQVPQMAPFGCLSKPAEWHAMLSVSDDQRSTFRAFLGSAHVHELWPVVTGVITHVALSVSSGSLTLVMNWQAGKCLFRVTHNSIKPLWSQMIWTSWKLYRCIDAVTFFFLLTSWSKKSLI